MHSLPRFFRVKQTFPVPKLLDIEGKAREQLLASGLAQRIQPGQTVAITAGSRGIANIGRVLRATVDTVKELGGKPYVVPAMGSHGGATAEGQIALLGRIGVTESQLGCEIRSSMETIVVCQAKEGFPVHFDKHASQADHVIVVNRVKPHTKFAASIESGLMKMMLIGLGKHAGAIVYHRAIMNFTFDQIVRSVAREVIARCRIAAGLAILENGLEETADLVGIAPERIELDEPAQLNRVRAWLPKLPFDHVEFLIVNRLGKDISGSGMDTNVIGRKYNDHCAMADEKPRVHNIYVRSLTEKTHGNATGLGIAELCHQRVVDALDYQATKVNCLTAGHLTAAMTPVVFDTDLEAIQAGLSIAGLFEPTEVPTIWIRDTLHLKEVECSESYWKEAQTRSDLEILSEPKPLEFDSGNELVDRFANDHE